MDEFPTIVRKLTFDAHHLKRRTAAQYYQSNERRPLLGSVERRDTYEYSDFFSEYSNPLQAKHLKSQRLLRGQRLVADHLKIKRGC